VVTPAVRAVLVTTLVAHPWAFAVATPWWVLALTTPMDSARPPRPRRAAAG
jgi:hypothetical protein